MSSRAILASKQRIITPPKWLLDNLMYETITGSQAYGIATEDSDEDIYGFCIPPKEMCFPHLSGEIFRFGKQAKRFEQFQAHGVKMNGKDYDFSIYSIVRFFHLCMMNNPNMISTLFTPRNCVTKSTLMSEMVREHRRDFLHKGAWHTYKGYAYSQLTKMKNRTPQEGCKRYDLVQKYGYDVKHGTHCVRLINEIEQILIEGDIDCQRNNDQLKAIRRGEWPLEDIEKYFKSKEKALDKLYNESKLPYGPDEEKIKALLLKCLEMHYGSLKDCVVVQNRHELACKEIREVLEKYNV